MNILYFLLTTSPLLGLGEIYLANFFVLPE